MAEVKVLLPGYFKWLGHNLCRASSTVTLIKDGKNKILVDTGTGNNQVKLLKALAKEHLKPAQINYVIITHAHPDHYENLGLFPKANSLNIYEIKKADIFKLTDDLLTKGERQLTPAVRLIATPGHTKECLSVLVKTTQGLVAVCGDLFVSRQIEKVFFVENKSAFKKSRNKIIKSADYIIPGHGSIFKVKK